LDQFKHHVLLSQNSIAGISFELGINNNGNLYTSLAGNEYIAGEEVIEPDQCYHLSVIYKIDDIDFFLNGNQIASVTRVSPTPDLSTAAPFYIGQSFPNLNTSFDGVMEELRIFTDERTVQEITSFLFQPLSAANDNKLVCFNFSTLLNGITHGTFNNHNLGILGGGDSNYSPQWWEEECIGDLPESVDPFCSSNTPTCSTFGLPTGELLCNGDFEQFCPALYLNHSTWNGTFPAWISTSLPFMQTNTSFGFPGSDVSNWNPLAVGPALTSPDIYVRNGVGSPSGFAPIWRLGNNGNWIANPPTNTWNGLDDAVVGLHGTNSSNSTSSEGIITSLNNALQPNTTYQFSGWFYKTDINGSSTSSGSLALEFTNGTNTYNPVSLSVPNYSSVIGNNSWFFGTVTFNTGASLPSLLSTLSIRNNGNTGDYILLDNLSLKSVSNQYFPQYFFTEKDNDYHHRRIKTDASNNVYVIATMENVSTVGNSQTGTLGLPTSNTFSVNAGFSTIVIKYNPDGQYLWHRHYDHLVLIDFDFDSSGNIVAVGHTEDNGQWPGVNYVGTNASSQITCTPPLPQAPSTQTINSFDTQQLLIYRVNATSGNTISSYAKGGTGLESGVGIHINGSTAYILVNTYGKSTCIGGSPSRTNTGLPWNGIYNTGPQLLRFNLQNNTESNAFGFTPHLPQMLKGDGNKLYLLRGDGNLDKVTVISANAHSRSTTSIDTDPTYLQPSADGSNLFVTYKGYNSVNNKVEQRATSDLGLVSSFITNKLPMAVASGLNGDYVLYRQNSTGTSPGKVLGIEKLDLANFGTPLWSKESAQHNGTMLNNFKTFGYEVKSDFAVYQNINNKLAIIGSFETIGNPWMIGFDASTLKGPQQGVGNCVILSLRDNGNTASFKKQPAAVDSSKVLAKTAFNLYPNPTNGELNIECANAFTKVDVYNLQGQRVKTQTINATQEFRLDLGDFVKGLYLVRIKTNDGFKQQKLIIE
jgi:hypothetical protein